jgi:hypothetical protein
MTERLEFTDQEKRIILGLESPRSSFEAAFVRNLSRHNTGLREDCVAALLNLEATRGCRGESDMLGKFEEKSFEFDLKHSLKMQFLDGIKTWRKKLEWKCLFCLFTPDGLVYLIMTDISECASELEECVQKLKGKRGRLSPTVPFEVWSKKSSTKVLYKNVDLFERYARKHGSYQKGDFKEKYNVIDKLPYSPILEALCDT